MGMSSHITGYISKDDEQWAKMLKIWNACEEAETEVPEKVAKFFESITDDGYDPNEVPGVSVDLEELDCCREYNADSVNGFEIDITKLPKDITVIRFCNCY